MTTTYLVTNAFAASVLEIKNPWLIVNCDYVVGAYEGRAAARAAKATGLAGKVVSLKEITLEITDTAEEIFVEETSVEPLVEEDKPFGFEDHGLTHCPSCGIHLNNGVGVHNQEVNGKHVKHDKFEYSCLSCDAEFGPVIEGKTEKAPKAKAEPKVIENRSTAEKPCRLVWDLADSMVGARRKDVIAAAVAKGVAFYTARTQYQLWAQIQKEMAARETAVVK